MNEFYTIRDAARVLGLSPYNGARVVFLIKRAGGSVLHSAVTGRSIGITGEELRKVQANGVGATARKTPAAAVLAA